MSKNFGSKKDLGPKEIFGQQKIGSQKGLGPKKCWNGQKKICKKILLVHIVISNNQKKIRVNRTTFRYIFRGGRFCPPPSHLGESETSPLRGLRL